MILFFCLFFSAGQEVDQNYFVKDPQGVYRIADRVKVSQLDLTEMNREMLALLEKMHRREITIPEGVKIEGDLISVEAKYQPDLVPISSRLNIIAFTLYQLKGAELKKEEHSLIEALILRGFPREDIQPLFSELDYVTLKNTERTFVKDAHDFVKSITQTPGMATKQEITRYLMRLRDAHRIAGDTWATQILNSISTHGQRVLISYLEEKTRNLIEFAEVNFSESRVESVLNSLKKEN